MASNLFASRKRSSGSSNAERRMTGDRSFEKVRRERVRAARNFAMENANLVTICTPSARGCQQTVSSPFLVALSCSASCRRQGRRSEQITQRSFHECSSSSSVFLRVSFAVFFCRRKKSSFALLVEIPRRGRFVHLTTIHSRWRTVPNFRSVNPLRARICSMLTVGLVVTSV